MQVVDVLPELVLVIGAALTVLLAAFTPQRLQALAAVFSGLALVLSFGLTLAQDPTPARLTFAGVWALDSAALFAKLVIYASALFAVALSPQWMSTDRRHGEYYGLVLFATLGAVMMASAADSMELIVGILLSSVASYPLVAYHRNWSPSLEAGMKYFLIGALANALLVIGVVLLFGLTGATGYPDMARELQANPDAVTVVAALTLILVGLTFKLGAFPGHPWMPDVAQGAPAPVAALVTVIAKIGAAVALARFVALIPDAIAWRWVIALLATITMTWGNLAALWQTNLRRLLGWSAVSQSGYALVAVTVIGLSDQAMPALLVFLAGYAVANLAAFAAVTHLRGRTELDHYNGLARVRPWTATVIILALLSFLGLPPLVGFFGKLLLFEAAIDGGYMWLAVVAILNSVISLFYYLRVIGPMIFSQPDDPVHDLGRSPAVVMSVTGVLVVILGLWVQALIAYAQSGTPL